jgi:hypothetical protein
MPKQYPPERVKELARILDITPDEVIEMLNDDERIDKGEKLFELTPEQEKASKKARQADRKPTVYKFDTSKRKRPANESKRLLIDTLKQALESIGASVEVTNIEREMVLMFEDTKYKVVLSAPRK